MSTAHTVEVQKLSVVVIYLSAAAESLGEIRERPL
jgi:hypothetical protein